MFRPNPNAREVSRRVARLPLDYYVCRAADHWVVAGPTGIFVVGRGADDVVATAELTVSLAHRLRARLSELIPWVPFVDALLVGGGDEDGLPCTAIDIGTLEMALLSGPLSIDEIGMNQLRQHLPEVVEHLDAPEDVNVTAVERDRPLDPA